MYIIKNWYWKLFLFVICLKNIVASEISIESLEEIFSNENNLARTQAIVDKKFDMKYFETDEQFPVIKLKNLVTYIRIDHEVPQNTWILIKVDKIKTSRILVQISNGEIPINSSIVNMLNFSNNGLLYHSETIDVDGFINDENLLRVQKRFMGQGFLTFQYTNLSSGQTDIDQKIEIYAMSDNKSKGNCFSACGSKDHCRTSINECNCREHLYLDKNQHFFGRTCSKQATHIYSDNTSITFHLNYLDQRYILLTEYTNNYILPFTVQNQYRGNSKFAIQIFNASEKNLSFFEIFNCYKNSNSSPTSCSHYGQSQGLDMNDYIEVHNTRFLQGLEGSYESPFYYIIITNLSKINKSFRVKRKKKYSLIIKYLYIAFWVMAFSFFLFLSYEYGIKKIFCSDNQCNLLRFQIFRNRSRLEPVIRYRNTQGRQNQMNNRLSHLRRKRQLSKWITQTDIEKWFPLFSVDNEFFRNRIDVSDKCAICQEIFDESKVLKIRRLVFCGHVIHDKCLWQWINIKPCCPICKTSLSKKQLRIYVVRVKQGKRIHDLKTDNIYKKWSKKLNKYYKFYFMYIDDTKSSNTHLDLPISVRPEFPKEELCKTEHSYYSCGQLLDYGTRRFEPWPHNFHSFVTSIEELPESLDHKNDKLDDDTSKKNKINQAIYNRTDKVLEKNPDRFPKQSYDTLYENADRDRFREDLQSTDRFILNSNPYFNEKIDKPELSIIWNTCQTTAENKLFDNIPSPSPSPGPQSENLKNSRVSIDDSNFKYNNNTSKNTLVIDI